MRAFSYIEKPHRAAAVCSLLAIVGAALGGCGQHHVIANDRISAEVGRQGATLAAFRPSDFSKEHVLCSDMRSDNDDGFTCRETQHIVFSSENSGSMTVTSALGPYRTMSYSLKFQLVGGMLCFRPQELHLMANSVKSSELSKAEGVAREQAFPDEKAFCNALVVKNGRGYVWTFFENGLPADVSSQPGDAVRLTEKMPSAYLPAV